MPTTIPGSGQGSYALLADGTTIEIRQATPADLETVRRFNASMSAGNLYLRFFGVSRRAAEQNARRVCRPPDEEHAALLAWLGDRLAGVASFEPAGANVAEVAFAVADDLHGRGIATLLLEHLVSIGRFRHLEAFCAQTLPGNAAMLRVFADAGLDVRRRLNEGVVEVTLPIPRAAALTEADTYLDAVARRESAADVESLRPLLRPASLAVVGASRSPGAVGRAILRNIISGGYTGRVYAVNPHAPGELEGVRCLSAVAALPEPCDLAVIAVPPAAVPAVAEECGVRGVRAIVVITSAVGPREGFELMAACRRYGMRLVGPNCFGVVVPGLDLDATFAASHAAPGVAGLVAQSGGLGFALLSHLSRIGVGVSSFVSLGNKYDVSGNDLLTWWERDGATRLAVLYLESFGNPRKFARTARRLGRILPVLTLSAGRTEAGLRAAASHTAAVATPLLSRRALFQQAGIIATDSLGELLDAVALLATQPPPTGSRVAVISNVGGAGVLAADACTECGLIVHQPSEGLQRRLREIVPPGGAVTGPVDTTAAIAPDCFRRCMEVIAAASEVDAMLVGVLATAVGDFLPAVCAADIRIPLAVVVLDQAEGLRLLTRTTPSPSPGPDSAAAAPAAAGKLPAYAYPESAARALGHAARYATWRSRPPSAAPDLPSLRRGDARALVASFLASLPGGGWLPPEQVSALLACYQIPLVPTRQVADVDQALAAAAELGGRVVLKADVPGVLHKTDAGALALDLRAPVEIRDAYQRFADAFAERLRGVLVQPMIIGGVEVIIGIVQDPVFGPVVVFGSGGVATEALGEHAARLTPLSTVDAEDLIHQSRAGRPLLGRRPNPTADVAALHDTLLRVSQLADDLPEVAELDLNPVIVRADGVFPVDARIRVTPRHAPDPFLRDLRELRQMPQDGQQR